LGYYHSSAIADWALKDFCAKPQRTGKYEYGIFDLNHTPDPSTLGSTLHETPRAKPFGVDDVFCFMGLYKFQSVVGGLLVAALFALPVYAQQAEPSKPVVVQPGAPGQPTRTLPASTRATLPPPSPADVQFMQGMIMHHAQAVEMTALIASHTENREIRTLGERISRSQSDEMKFMKRWLETKGQPTPTTTSHGSQGLHGPETHDGDMPGHNMLMPGMLTPKQLDALRKTKGKEFDHLFLSGMIQHHNGALVMVKELFDTAGAGQDAELFNFATDVDSGQRAEIRAMQKMLGDKSL
jgi:uncharacterized protein (DUF305 family)